MKRKNATRHALFTSIISLLLCVSMLMGTTFAWFTDEVVSGMNTIAAGNLDVELYANGAKVDATTKLFDDVTLWEPGVVTYENLQVANVGTLALKYQMTLNFGNENTLNGHKLSEVLKVAVIDKVADTATRADVLAAAKAAVEADQGIGNLSNFYLTGELEAGASSTEQAVVIFWEPNDNATDNLYNANNGQVTSDGEPLHIDFGVNLQATQKMSEEDSFGDDYDEFSSILPKATVNNVSAQYPTVTATYGIGGAESEIPLNFALQFLPNEQYEVKDETTGETTPGEAQSSEYRYWHADYVIKADKDVKANSMALAGYYKEWCQYNNNNWVALTSPTDITANTEIRLVESLGVTVNYEEICKYGNDGTGFLCGATDLTGENAGTTITVELRLYETTIDPSSNSGSTNIETGHYEVVGKYTYTFANTVSTADELVEELTAGHDVTLANDIEMDVDETGFTVANGQDVKIDLNGHDIIATSTSAEGVQLFSVSGNLEIVGNGTVSLTNDDYAWTNDYRYTTINIRETGVVTLGEGVNIICDAGADTEKGYGMSYAVDIYTTGTLNVDGASLHSNYIAVRCFFGASVVNVNSGSSITSSKDNYGIWPQSANGAVITIADDINYTINEDYGIYIFA